MFKKLIVVLLLACMFWCGTCIADHHKLSQELIRLHVVGASDSETDQAVKLQVRDAILDQLHAGLGKLTSQREAKVYIQNHRLELESVGNQALKQAGMDMVCSVSLTRECFPTREYETFSLPAGVYDSLRVTIGQGEGKNWWCVVFPEMCVPASGKNFEAVAAASGFPDSLTGALSGEEHYQIRFFFLECLGKLENILRKL